MTRYASGRAVEYKARNELMREGYTVIRAAGSKGAIDLAAFDRKGLVLVQVKASRKPVAQKVINAALMQMAVLERPIGSRCEVWAYTLGHWRKFRLANMNGQLVSAEQV